MNKMIRGYITLFILISVSHIFCMSRDMVISYSQHARDKMNELKITVEDVREIIENGDRYEDKKHPNSLIYAQRSAYPRDEREYDQLVVVISKEPKNGAHTVITTYFNDDIGALRTPEQQEKKTKLRQKSKRR